MEEDGTGMLWSDKPYLSYVPLAQENAMAYFAMSPFYDKSCNNELVHMQRLDEALMATMEGIEYSLLPPVCEHLYRVTKSRRTVAPKPSLTLLAVYYILNGNIYQAPTAHAVLSSRIVQSLHHLRRSFDTLQAHALPAPAPASASSSACHWRPPPAAAAAALRDDEDAETDAGTYERRAVDSILYDVLDKNRRIAAATASMRAAPE